MASKIVFLFFTLTCTLFMANNAIAARELPINIEPGLDLERRLEESGGLVECWNALMEIKSCTNEILAFFLNGQTEIGPSCCKAITLITHHCWPSMLTSLGFTVAETDILRGYCDASSGLGPVASPPISDHVMVNV